jgi:UDP:flavonoid glycosyltransferase YjiC (YdhE family)
MPLFILTAIGSYGDVHPIVGLATALAARGHRVKLITNPYFADVVTGAGIDFVPVSTRDEYVRLSQHPDLWHPIKGPALALKEAAGGLARPLYELAMILHESGDTVFCSHPLDLGTRVAGEKLQAPVVSIDLSPSMLWSIYDSPRLKGALTGPRVPKWIKRLQVWMSDSVFVRPILGPPINGLRREIGLPPVKRFFSQWMHATELTLGLFPEWFATRQPDWPPNVRLVGFPLWDANEETALAPELQEFLQQGEPPLAFSPGSANHAARPFFKAAVDACRRLGRRGILLTKYGAQLPERLPEGVRHFGFVPLSRLLPHMAAVVHHGGIGSCAQALAAGVPQLVQPMSFDQFDNSRRLARLGVAEELSVRRFRGPAVAEALDRLLSSAEVRVHCRASAEKCDGVLARSVACDAVERLIGAPVTR